MMVPKSTEANVEKIRAKYPFGERVRLSEFKKVAYTGRSIEPDGAEILVSQTEFINGHASPSSQKGQEPFS